MQKLKHFLGIWVLIGLLAGSLVGRFSQPKSEVSAQIQKEPDTQGKKSSPRKPQGRLIYWKASEK